MPLAQAQPAAAEPTPAARDRREEFIPGDPLGTRLGGESIAGTAAHNERIILQTRADPDASRSADERNRAHRAELSAVVLVLTLLAVLVLWLYWRRGHVNFAGHGHNRE